MTPISRLTRQRFSAAPVHVVLMTFAVVMATPFAWMILTSLKTFIETVQVPPTLLPEVWRWENYLRVLEVTNFPIYYLNTIVMTVGRTVGQLLLCSLAAFAFARLSFPFRNTIFILFLSVLMVPIQAVLIPGFVLMRTLGWLDTFYALIVPGMFSAFGTFLLRQFFLTIPRELDDAARIDGASYFGIYWRIYLPLSIPALVALTIFTVLASWNDFLWPLVMTSSEEMRVLSVGLATFRGQHATDFPLLMAGSLMATAPMILLFLLLQRYFIAGIASSGIKE